MRSEERLDEGCCRTVTIWMRGEHGQNIRQDRERERKDIKVLGAGKTVL